MRRRTAISFELWLDTHGQEKAVERLLEVHTAIAKQAAPPGTSHRWHFDTREALVSAGVVLLVSYLQAYLEAIFKKAAATAYPNLSEAELNEVVNGAIAQFHNPTPSHIDRLFLSVGVPRLTYGVHWSRWPNQRVRKELKRLVDARHHIAHGVRTSSSFRRFSVNKAELVRWHRLTVRFLDHLVARFYST